MTIEEIYKRTDNLIITHLMVNDDAMKITQSIGYNGFKRLHRYLAKELMCKHQWLNCQYFDRFRKTFETDISIPTYKPVSFKDHLEKWKDLLEKGIQELGELNQEHFDVVGVTNETIECVICIFVKKLEKVNRWIMRFNESNWNAIDIHKVDDDLHCKMKKKEEGD